jgi:hypothetical protein
MTNKYLKKCLTTLAIKQIQIKTILRFYLTPVRRAIILKTNNRCQGRWEKGGWGRSLYILLVGMQISVITMEKSIEVSSKT